MPLSLRHILGTALVGVLLFSAPTHARKVTDWQHVGVTAGVSVDRKTIPNSALFAFRGEGVFDVPLGLLVAVLKNPELAVEWVDLMTDHHVVRSVGENQNLIYESYGLPWPIADRDYLMMEKYGYFPQTKSFTIDYESVSDPERPENKDHVRATVYRTFWRLTMVDADTTKVQIEVATNPKGALPAWVINMIQKDWPWKTIDGLVKRASKGDVQSDPNVAGW